MGMDAVNNSMAASYQPSVPKPVQVDSYQYVDPYVAQTAVAPQEAIQPMQQQSGTGQQDGQQPRGQKQPTHDEIKAAIHSANKRAHFGNTSAQFSYHEKTKRISVKIFDKDTNEVIREIPPEETLDMIAKMYELAGIMIDEKR